MLYTLLGFKLKRLWLSTLRSVGLMPIWLHEGNVQHLKRVIDQ